MSRHRPPRNCAIGTTGRAVCTPTVEDPAMKRAPFMKFAAGYVTRGTDKFPKQGAEGPW